jgi:hypothetical protein
MEKDNTDSEANGASAPWLTEGMIEPVIGPTKGSTCNQNHSDESLHLQSGDR